ncbi:MAG: DUF72 domain-containing protein [Polyangiales bacterium]
MLHVGCSGFPVPATRYLREFHLEEVADTLLGVPGPALVRRWRREAPTGFVFTALCPKELGAELFKPNAAAEAAWESFLPVARELDARAIVVTSPPELPTGKVHRASVRTFFERMSVERLPPVVWEPPATWPLKDGEAAVKDLAVLVARDPFRHPPFGKVPLAYYRLPGPAGFKSRYEDPAIDAIAETLRQTKADDTLVVFANVDMHADAKRLKKVLGD